MTSLMDLQGRAESLREFLTDLQERVESSGTNLELEIEEHVETANDICKLISFSRAMSEHDYGNDELCEEEEVL